MINVWHEERHKENGLRRFFQKNHGAEKLIYPLLPIKLNLLSHSGKPSGKYVERSKVER